MPDFAAQVVSLIEDRLPLDVRSIGPEDDWDVVAPALLAAAARHLRATEQLQNGLRSRVVGWQLVRSMYEYVVTFAWIAGDPDERRRLWLKSDYQQRLKLDDDFTAVNAAETALLNPDQRRRIAEYVEEVGGSMPSVPNRAASVDERWAGSLAEIEAHLPEGFRRFRTLYPLIYRNGSQFTHPTSHAVAAFVTGRIPHLHVGLERSLERDLVLVATGIMALGLAVAVTATPVLQLTHDQLRMALSG